MNNIELIENFFVDSIKLERESNKLEKTNLYNKFIKEYKIPINNLIERLTTRLNVVEQKFKEVKKNLKKEAITEEKPAVLVKSPRHYCSVNLFGKPISLPIYSKQNFKDSIMYCPTKKLIIIKMLDSMFYFSPPTIENSNERVVDCNSERCYLEPKKDCKFYHRPEYYSHSTKNKNYIRLYLPKPLSYLDYNTISDLLFKSVTDGELNVLKDYISYLLITYLLLSNKLG